jgi:peptidyl-prolyl cis-trans isomerase SurA
VVRRKFRHEITVGEVDVDKAISSGGGAEASAAPTEATALQLRQIKFELSGNADQRMLASRLAEAEALRARFESCSNVGELAKGIKGASMKVLADQQPGALAQPARLLVMNAKVGQMTPPTISASAIELYAVCGKRAVKGDPQQRVQTEHKLMQQEMEIRAERLLRDMRQDAFIEYRS